MSKFLVWDKAVFKGKFIALHVYTREERSQINNLRLSLTKLEKATQNQNK